MVELALRNNPFVEVVRLERRGANPNPPISRSIEAVRESDVYIGIFGRKFSQATKEEFHEARRLGKPCFAYISDDNNRDLAQSEFILNELDRTVTRYRFRDFEDLSSAVSDNINDFLGDSLTLGIQRWPERNEAVEVDVGHLFRTLVKEGFDYGGPRSGKVEVVPSYIVGSKGFPLKIVLTWVPRNQEDLEYFKDIVEETKT